VKIPEKDRPIVWSALLFLAAVAIAGFVGCAEVPVKHYRPTMGCYPQMCEFADHYACSCWAPGVCFDTERLCEQNYKATVKDVAADLFNEMAKNGDVWTI
jgi:hypothetical protein